MMMIMITMLIAPLVALIMLMISRHTLRPIKPKPMVRRAYPATLKASRSRPLIHAGSLPRPDQVAPVAGSR